jgi:hypothetical protein
VLREGQVIVGLRAEFARYDDAQDVDHRDLTTSVSAAFQITERVRLDLDLPRHDYDADRYHDEGPGDLSLAVRARPFDGPLEELTLLAGLRLPSGDRGLDRFAGAGAEVVALGRGTTDLFLGAAWSATIAGPVRLGDDLVYVEPLTENDDAPPPGVLLGSPSARAVQNRLRLAVAATDWLEPYLAVTAAWKAEADGPAAAGDSGETLVWVTLGVAALLPGDLTVDVSTRLAHEIVTVGVSKRF